MKTKKTKKRGKSLDSKKEKVLETYMVIGVMIGSVVGTILSFVNDNFVFLALCTSLGLSFGLVLSSIVNKDIVFTFWPAKKKKKSNKK